MVRNRAPASVRTYFFRSDLSRVGHKPCLTSAAQSGPSYSSSRVNIAGRFGRRELSSKRGREGGRGGASSGSSKCSNSNGSADEGISECARDLSALSERIRRGTASEITMQMAQLLSPTARAEFSAAHNKLALERESNFEKVVETSASSVTPAMAATATAESVSSQSEIITNETPLPSKRDLRLHAITGGIPFIGFGIMDNAILIWAGDQIDTHLGVLFGISTLCAAAIGNIISDIAGVGLGTYIEDICSRRLKLPVANLSHAQRQLRSVRFAGQFGNGIGLTIGCIIGMFPLLLIDTEKVQKLKQDAHMESLFRDMVIEAKGLIGAEATCLFLVVDSKESTTPPFYTYRKNQYRDRFLYGKYADGSVAWSKAVHVPLGKGIVSRAVMTREVLNIYDARTEPDFSYESDIIGVGSPEKIKNMLCVPVFDAHGNVIAVIQAVNKLGDGKASKNGAKGHVPKKGRGFTTNDTLVLQALASHVSVSLQTMHQDDAKVSLSDTIHILVEHGTSALDDHNSATNVGFRKRRPLFPDAEQQNEETAAVSN